MKYFRMCSWHLAMLEADAQSTHVELSNFCFEIFIDHHHHSSSLYSVQRQVFHYKLRHQGSSSAEQQVFHSKLRNQGCSFTRMNRCSSFLLLSATHSLFSIWTDLKVPRGPSMEVRRVDLANWNIWTSSKFTRGVKYQFRQGFWPDQRSRNPNHHSPPIYSYGTLYHEPGCVKPYICILDFPCQV